MINAVGNRMMIEINRQQSLARAIADTQIAVSTGKRMQRASDDPVSAARVATIARSQANNKAWLVNLETGLSLNSQADIVASGMADNMAKVRELVLAGASGAVITPADRQTLAAQLDGIAAELDSLANRQTASGQPLFSAGSALSVRYDATTALAPVPSLVQIFYVGGVSLSQLTRDAAIALRSGTAAAINASLSTLDLGISHIADVLGDIGQRGVRLQSLYEASRIQDIDFAAERSNLESTDLSEAIALLNAQTLTLDAAQAAFARINRRTLFDVLS